MTAVLPVRSQPESSERQGHIIDDNQKVRWGIDFEMMDEKSNSRPAFVHEKFGGCEEERKFILLRVSHPCLKSAVGFPAGLHTACQCFDEAPPHVVSRSGVACAGISQSDDELQEELVMTWRVEFFPEAFSRALFPLPVPGLRPLRVFLSCPSR